MQLGPWDDLPGLVMADWYEEYGQELHAEVIRAECEYAASQADGAARILAAVRGFVAVDEGYPSRRTLGRAVATPMNTARG